MLTYEEFERQMKKSIEASKPDMESIHCPGCGCRYFSEKVVSRYSAVHTTVVGGLPPLIPNTATFKLLQCAKCSKLVPPTITWFAHDSLEKEWSAFLDMIENLNKTNLV